MISYLMTDKGLARNANQDDVLAIVKENGDALYVLCDGMGGHSGGAIACKKCINVFKKDFMTSKYTNSEEAKQWLYKMILKANKEIISMGEKSGKFGGSIIDTKAYIKTQQENFSLPVLLSAARSYQMNTPPKPYLLHHPYTQGMQHTDFCLATPQLLSLPRSHPSNNHAQLNCGTVSVNSRSGDL